MPDETKPLPKACKSVLKRLMGGWTLDRHGRNGMRGVMVRGRGEQAVVAEKTMSALLGYGMIVASVSGVMDFEITSHGKYFAYARRKGEA